MGSSSSKQKNKGGDSQNTDTKWNQANTENISSDLEHQRCIRKCINDRNKLIKVLIPNITSESESEFNLNKLDFINKSGPEYKLNSESSEIFLNSKDAEKYANSTTSDINVQELSKNLTLQQGGKNKKHTRTLKGGEFLDDDSDTSSTSDSDLKDIIDDSDDSDDSDSDNKKKKKKHDKKPSKNQESSDNLKKHDKKPSKIQESSDELTGGSDLSYLSSSAQSSITMNKGINSSVSINTSDINMVSDY